MDSIIKEVNTTEEYWKKVLEDEHLGMNRGTIFQKDEDDIEIDAQAVRQLNGPEKKPKRGRPRKTGFKGTRLNFTKLDAEASTRSTYRPGETSGVFQVGGFRYYGPSVCIGAGRGGSKGPETYDHFITYVGGSTDLTGLEEKLSREEDGKSRPPGHGPDA